AGGAGGRRRGGRLLRPAAGVRRPRPGGPAADGRRRTGLAADDAPRLAAHLLARPPAGAGELPGPGISDLQGSNYLREPAGAVARSGAGGRGGFLMPCCGLPVCSRLTVSLGLLAGTVGATGATAGRPGKEPAPAADAVRMVEPEGDGVKYWP